MCGVVSNNLECVVERPYLTEELNRSRGRGYGLTLEVRERPVTRLYVGE
jgi:hypothetical protein